MGNRLIRLVVYKVYQMEILSHVELRKMRYGMEVVFNELIKMVILLALFIMLNNLEYFLFSLYILITIRCFSGGLHFQTNLRCLLFSIIFFLTTSFAATYLPIEFIQYRYFVMVFSIGTIGVLSPIASVNRPIKSKRKQHMLRLIAVLFTASWLYILLFNIKDSELVSCGIATIMLQAIQLIAGYIFNLFKNTNTGRRGDMI